MIDFGSVVGGLCWVGSLGACVEVLGGRNDKNKDNTVCGKGTGPGRTVFLYRDRGRLPPPSSPIVL